MIHYFAKVSARVKCGWCAERKLVTNGEDLDCADEHMDCFGDQIKSAIEQQMEEGGWLGRYCPDCRETHGKEIAADEGADDYEMEDER